MVYGYCLLYDGEIIPYPNIDEIVGIEEHGGKPAKRCPGRQCTRMETDLRLCGSITYATDWPSVALLGVSKNIREVKHLWTSYAHHFRHISTHMSMNDTSNMLTATKLVRAEGRRQGWSTKILDGKIHDTACCNQTRTFDWKQNILVYMRLLKSLTFSVGNLFCPHGCCREGILENLCLTMGRDGPWWMELDKEAESSWDAATNAVVPDVKAKLKIDVKVVGLDDGSEEEIFMRWWGLEVERGQGQ